MSVTQKNTFYAWITRNNKNQVPAMTWYQIRANQLRKSAGLLERYYATEYPDSSTPQPMTPSFIKDEWQPGPTGHVLYINGDDVIPSINVSHLKDYFKHMLQRDDEGMFWMNWLRNHIERHEDMANMHYDAAIAVPKLQGDLNTMFSSPEFENVLVDDTKTSVVGVNGVSLPGPFNRTSQLNPQTAWETSLDSHLDSGLGISTPPQPSSA
jgi:hypothetical protein